MADPFTPEPSSPILDKILIQQSAEAIRRSRELLERTAPLAEGQHRGRGDHEVARAQPYSHLQAAASAPREDEHRPSEGDARPEAPES